MFYIADESEFSFSSRLSISLALLRDLNFTANAG